MNRRLIVFLVAVIFVFSACHNGSFEVADSGSSSPSSSGINEHSHHPYTWDLQSDGSWKCSKCGEYVEGTTSAYMAVIENGQPSIIYPIKSPYTYSNTTGTSKTVIIRTLGGTLNIDAPSDTIWHYGWVDVVNMDGANSVYEGHAPIRTELAMTCGTALLEDDIGEEIPLITVPSTATDHVSIEIDPDVFVEHIEVASGTTTDIFVEGAVDIINYIGTGNLDIDVEGKIATTTGVTVDTGSGYVISNNGTGHYNLPNLTLVGDTYLVATRLDMASFKIMCNVDGNTFEGKTVQLQNDINLSGLWEPIGKWVSGTGETAPTFNGVFKGTFDGNGKSINNMRVSSSTGSYQGLFGYTEGATIQDVTVNGAVSCKEQAGGIVAYMRGGTMSNVTSNVAVSSERIAGGLAGRVYVTDGTATVFDTCVNNGIITGRSSSGNSGVGGIAGEIRSNGDVTFTDCINLGMSDDTNGTHVGGILGYVHSAHTGDVTFTDCVNSATVYGGRTGVLAKVGGILGCHTGGSTITLTGCRNTGSISSNAIAGGILGYSYDGTPGMAILVNCKSNAPILSTDSGYYAGGVVGTMLAGSLDADCEGGTGALTGTYTGRLLGRSLNKSAGSGIQLTIGTGRVGNVNEKTIGYTGGSSAPNIRILGGTLYGKPYSTTSAVLEFSNGTHWVQDSNTTIDITSDGTRYKATSNSSNWTLQ